MMGWREMWNSVDGLSNLIEKANWGIAFTLLAAFACTVVVIKAGHRKDELAAIDELEKNKKIAETSERAENLEKDNLEVRGKVATLETKAGVQQERAAKAEKALLQLQESLKWRHLSPEEEKRLVAALTATSRKGRVNVVGVVGDAEVLAFANQIDGILTASGWPTADLAQGGYAPTTPVGLGVLVHSIHDIPPCVHDLLTAFRV